MPTSDVFQAAIQAEADGKHELAEAGYRVLLAEEPSDPVALRQLASVLGAQLRHAEALPYLELATAIDPYNAIGFNQLASAYGRVGMYAKSEECVDRALSLSWHYGAAHWNKADALLRRGEFKQGWAEWEWGRFVNARPNRSPLPTWDGGECDSLLAWAEQGMGDAILALRYLPLLAARVRGRIYLELHEQLVPLVTDYPSVDAVFPIQHDGGIPYRCDAQIALMSLPHVLGLDAPPTGAYLAAKAPVPITKAGRYVGLAWRGNTRPDPNRTMPVEAAQGLADALTAAGATVVCLSPDGPLERVLALPMHDFNETANIVASLDAVVSIDTSVAHLAGAMGKPLHVMLPAVFSAWIWGMGDRSAFYPDATLHRQTTLGVWGTVIQSVCAALA